MKYKNITRTAQRVLSTIGLGIGLSVALPLGLSAADFPEHPVTIVVAYAPGGGTDTAIRAMAKVVSEKLGQQILVQNVTGAGGGVAALKVSRAKPDGYTLLATNSTSYTLEPLIRKTAFQMDSFTPVGIIAAFQGAMFAHKDKKFGSLDELIALAKSEKRAIKFASFLSIDRLVMQFIGKQKGIEVIPVPVSGGNGSVQMVLSGAVDMGYSGGSWAPIVKAGDAKGMFATSFERLRLAPDLPAMKDMGYPFGTTSFLSLSAPAGTPKAAIAKIAEAISAGVASKMAQNVGEKRNMDMTFQGPESAAKTLQAERDAYVAILKAVE